MKNYVFYDSDPSGREEFDISGQQYLDLMNCCFSYAVSFSLILSPCFKDDIQHWNKYRIDVEPDVVRLYSHYGTASPESPDKIKDYEIRHYRLCPELCDMILSRTDSIFKWLCGWGYNNPDDPCFFREDGSVLFSSIIHEGECRLSLRDGENPPEFLK